jgi:hypothetical protein
MSRTLRRDLPSCCVLKKVLEAKGDASVVVCSQRSVFYYLRHWRPQALVYPSSSDTRYFAPDADRVKLFCYPGEGGESFEHYNEKFFIHNPEYLGKVHRLLLWGNATRRFLLEEENAVHHGRYRDILDNDKIRVVGHPRLDLARFFPRRKPRRSIGICTHFFTLNNFRGDTALRLAFGEPESLKALDFEVELLEAVVKIINYVLEHTDYDVSIRPYPLEAPQMYYMGKGNKNRFHNPRYQGRVSIDGHLDYPGWASEQELVISSVTTALSESYFVGTPMIFISNMLKRTNEFVYYNSINKLLGDATLQPDSFEELTHYLRNPQDTPFDIQSIIPFMSEYYNTGVSGSSLARAADVILADVRGEGRTSTPYVPAAFIHLREWANFCVERIKDPLAGNFNYLRGYHSIPDYYDQIATNIAAGRETSPRPVHTDGAPGRGA